MKHTERPAEGAEFKPLVVKARWWETGSDRTFLTKKRHSYTEGYDAGTEVYLPDGTWLGTVEKYTGSLDRKYAGSRLRHPGKRRTLWSYQGPGEGRPMFGQVSRADCIRALAREHEQRKARGR